LARDLVNIIFPSDFVFSQVLRLQKHLLGRQSLR
jgi:hypothetical protein